LSTGARSSASTQHESEEKESERTQCLSLGSRYCTTRACLGLARSLCTFEIGIAGHLDAERFLKRSHTVGEVALDIYIVAVAEESAL
jgi:hypothetical protein